MPSLEYEKLYQGMIRRLELRDPVNRPMLELRKWFEDSMRAYSSDPDIALHQSKLGSVPVLEVAAPGICREQIVFFFHGGGYWAGSSWNHRDLMGRLSRATRALVIGVDYRLAPEQPFPAALEDAIAAYRAVLQNHSPKKIALVGVSAGAGLALALLLALKERKDPLPRCYVGISPWADLTLSDASLETNKGKDIISKESLHQARKRYCQNHDFSAPFISPLFGDLSNLPPLMIQAGSREVLLSQIQELVRRAKAQGTIVHYEEWPDMFHAWQLFAKDIPEGRSAIQKIGDWIIQHQTL